MKKIINISIIFILLAQVSFAQGFISAVDLAKTMKSPDVVVVSVRKKADYDKVHITGAVNVDITDLHIKTPVDGMLKSKSEIASILGKRGITTNKKIVLYCKTGVRAARLYWILKYMGCKDVKMLNGHMTGWRAARKPVTKIVPKITPATFTPIINSALLVNKAYVKTKLTSANTVLVDARKTEEFGAGHIGNAVNIPVESLINDDNTTKSKEAVQAIFNGKGVSKSKEIILYCKTSTKSGLLYFLMTSELGYTNVKIYDGAYNEWSM